MGASTSKLRSLKDIPEFESYEEEARFWDSIDLGEFEDELEPVELEVEGPIGHILSVRLDSKNFRRLVAAARWRGIGFHALAEQWILESLDRAEADTKTPSE